VVRWQIKFEADARRRCCQPKERGASAIGTLRRLAHIRSFEPALLTYKSQASARACRREAEVVQVLAIVKAAQVALSTVAQHGHDRLSCKAKNRRSVIPSRTCDTH